MADTHAMVTQVFLRVLYALSDGIVAVLFLAIWIDPRLFSVPFIAGVIGTLGIEAALAFSGIFLFATYKSLPHVKSTYLVMSVPLLIALSLVSAIAVAAHSVWIYLNFLWLTASRIASLIGTGADAKERTTVAFGSSIVSLFGLMVLSFAMALPVPPLGYNATAIKALGLPVFVEERPQGILFLGFLYFGVRTGIKLAMHRLTVAEIKQAKQDKLIRF